MWPPIKYDHATHGWIAFDLSSLHLLIPMDHSNDKGMMPKFDIPVDKVLAQYTGELCVVTSPRHQTANTIKFQIPIRLRQTQQWIRPGYRQHISFETFAEEELAIKIAVSLFKLEN